MQQNAKSDSTGSLGFPPEIRTDPLTCPREKFAEANLAEGRTGERAFESVDVALVRIRRLMRPSTDLLKSWSLHPDERVPIAMLTTGIVQPGTRESKEVLPFVAARAVREARERGEIWTPLLDVLSRGIWRDATVTSPPLVSEEFTERHYLMTTVGPWLERHQDAELLRRLVRRTRSTSRISFIAETTTIADRTLVEDILRTCPTAMVGFAMNDHLHPEAREFVLDYIVAAARPANDWDSHMTDCIEEAFRSLVQRGVSLRPDHVDQLLGTFDKHAPPITRMESDVCERVLCLVTLDAYGTRDEDLALRAIEMAQKADESYWVSELLPCCTRFWCAGAVR